MFNSKVEYEYNGLKFRHKGNSNIMKFFGLLMTFFAPTFMTNIFTTFLGVIYVPDDIPFDDTFPSKFEFTLIHEKQHLIDREKIGFWFYILYAFPIFPFILPLPIGYWRYKFERNAFVAELDARVEVYKQKEWPKEDIDKNIKFQVDRISEVLGSSMYLWPWPKKSIKKWFYKNYNLK